MALHKYPRFLRISQDQAFDNVHAPGTATPLSGIYKCESCGDEIASNRGQPLPPQNHHQHRQGLGPIRWRLIVFAEQA
jgi:hypothetical protein